MVHGDAREWKWRGNWRMEWVASTLHTTSEHGVSSITTADAHTSAASSRLDWRPHRFKWTRPFRRKTKSGFCACAITFQLASTSNAAYQQIYGLFFYLFVYLYICLFIYKFCLLLYFNFALSLCTSSGTLPHFGKPCCKSFIWSPGVFANQYHLEYSLTKRYQQQCAHRPRHYTYFGK